MRLLLLTLYLRAAMELARLHKESVAILFLAIVAALATMVRRLAFDVEAGDEVWLSKLRATGYTKEEADSVHTGMCRFSHSCRNPLPMLPSRPSSLSPRDANPVSLSVSVVRVPGASEGEVAGSHMNVCMASEFSSRWRSGGDTCCSSLRVC